MKHRKVRLKLLFVCNHNRLRSPTAQNIFSDDPFLEVRSAGVDKNATVPVTEELLKWADIIFAMEDKQKDIIRKRFKDIVKGKRMICLYIPDEYDFMAPDLIELLKERVTPYLLKGIS